MIEALDGQLITNSIVVDAKITRGLAVSDVENDVLKLVVLNRYAEAKPAVAFVRGFGLQQGAFASSVAHDSHNILAAGRIRRRHLRGDQRGGRCRKAVWPFHAGGRQICFRYRLPV